MLIDESASASLTANVLAPGYVRIVPTGYLVSQRRDGTWIAPLLPQLFLGADGEQLSSWRQYIPQAGSQVILTKPAGDLLIPRSELAWRKVREGTAIEPSATVQTAGATDWAIAFVIFLAPIVVGGLAVAWTLFRRR